MSDDGSSHLGPDEVMKREQAERLLTDIYDVVVLIAGAYANKILPPLLPHLPYTLPSDVVAHHLSKLGIVHDAIMAWATEALERAGVPQPQLPVSEAERTLYFKRLEELGRQHAEVRSELGSAERMVWEAVWQLAALTADSPAGAWNRVWSELGRAIHNLTATSAHLMRLDAEHGVARLNEGRQGHRRQPTTYVGTKAPLRSTQPSPRAPLSGRILRQPSKPASRPGWNQGPRAPGAR